MIEGEGRTIGRPARLASGASRERRERADRVVAGVVAASAHTLFFAALVSVTPDTLQFAEIERRTATTVVFRVQVGPGGGGGGGGESSTEPPSELDVEGPDPVPAAVPQTDTLSFHPEPEPEAAESPPDIVAPIEPAASDDVDQAGVLEPSGAAENSAGPGTGGGGGEGEGTGIGSGQGSGIGEGREGGFGGGAYRLGSGVTPPVAIRRVEPDYTPDALQRLLQGNVVLEIVILADGSVGSARVLVSLEPGLDQRAIDAAQMWRFVPGKMGGEPVAVIAELVVEFRLY